MVQLHGNYMLKRISMKDWTKKLIQQLIFAAIQALTYFFPKKEDKETISAAVDLSKNGKGKSVIALRDMREDIPAGHRPLIDFS